MWFLLWVARLFGYLFLGIFPVFSPSFFMNLLFLLMSRALSSYAIFFSQRNSLFVKEHRGALSILVLFILGFVIISYFLGSSKHHLLIHCWWYAVVHQLVKHWQYPCIWHIWVSIGCFTTFLFAFFFSELPHKPTKKAVMELVLHLDDHTRFQNRHYYIVNTEVHVFHLIISCEPLTSYTDPTSWFFKKFKLKTPGMIEVVW